MRPGRFLHDRFHPIVGRIRGGHHRRAHRRRRRLAHDADTCVVVRHTPRNRRGHRSPTCRHHRIRWDARCTPRRAASIGASPACSRPAACRPPFATVLIVHTHLDGLRGSKIVATTLGDALMLTAASLILRAACGAQRADAPALSSRDIPAPILTVFILGTLVSLSSVGRRGPRHHRAFFLYPRLSAARIVASDLAHAVPLTFVAGLGHSGSARRLDLLASLLIGPCPASTRQSLRGRVPETICVRPRPDVDARGRQADRILIERYNVPPDNCGPKESAHG